MDPISLAVLGFSLVFTSLTVTAISKRHFSQMIKPLAPRNSSISAKSGVLSLTPAQLLKILGFSSSSVKPTSAGIPTPINPTAYRILVDTKAFPIELSSKKSLLEPLYRILYQNADLFRIPPALHIPQGLQNTHTNTKTLALPESLPRSLVFSPETQRIQENLESHSTPVPSSSSNTQSRYSTFERPNRLHPSRIQLSEKFSTSAGADSTKYLPTSQITHIYSFVSHVVHAAPQFLGSQLSQLTESIGNSALRFVGGSSDSMFSPTSRLVLLGAAEVGLTAFIAHKAYKFINSQEINLQRSETNLQATRQMLNEMHHRNLSCVVCMDNERSVVFLPCRHVASCSTCSQRLRTCPCCRTTIEQRSSVVLA